jgi:hypothetical protein
MLAVKGKRTVPTFHRELGKLMWDECGMARNAEGLKRALERIPGLREEFWQNVNVPGSGDDLNQSLEHAGRLADFLEFGELMCRDALERDESCGGHFRVEHQTEDGEASATTSGSRTLPSGSTPARTARRADTPSRSPSRTSRSHSGATSNGGSRFDTADAARLAAGGAEQRGRVRDVRGRERLDPHVLPRAARPRQRTARGRGQGADRLRPRLPRGHLRIVRLHDQRRAARTAAATTTVCQLHMRHYRDGDELWLEPWRATGFPVLKDLAVDRSAFDRIIQAGGYISVRTGSAPDANAIAVPKEAADAAMDAAECIACGACVAACPNASAMLFTSAKVAHLNCCRRGSRNATGA